MTYPDPNNMHQVPPTQPYPPSSQYEPPAPQPYGYAQSVQYGPEPTWQTPVAPSPPPRSKKRWIIPTATGLLGLVVGSGMSGGDTTTTTPLTSATVTRTTRVTVPAKVSTVTVTPKIRKAVDVPTKASSKKTTKAKPTTEGAATAYYADCSAARAADAAPLRVGDPGYRSGLDRDGDGVACE
jgi:hypothetical protein